MRKPGTPDGTYLHVMAEEQIKGMKYCFLLPAYKARFFEEALGSILSQTYKEFEVIVSDDCSPEDLKSIVDKYADPRVTYRRNEKNIGGTDLVLQWNNCLAMSAAEYVILASDDDIYSPKFLEEIDGLVSKFPDVDIFRARTQRIDGEGNRLHEDPQLPKVYYSFDEFIRLFADDTIVSGIPQYLYKRESLVSMGGFPYCPAAWYSDNMIAMALSKHGIAISHEVLFFFRMSGLNISATNSRKLIAQKVGGVKYFQNYLDVIFQGLPNKEEFTSIFRDKARRITMDCISHQGFSDFIYGLSCCAMAESSWMNFSWRVKKLLGYILRQVGIIKRPI